MTLELVSQVDKTVLVVFATENAKTEFESRLQELARGRRPTRAEIFYAIKGVDNWGPDDRTGLALRREGAPSDEPFLLDLELWPLQRPSDRASMINALSDWCSHHGATILDSVNQPTIVIVRVNATRSALRGLLRHRDVRTVDLPPRTGVPLHLVRVPAQELPDVPSPQAGAPTLAVLDSGVTSNHPVLAPAIGDAQSFLADKGSEDENGHGTMVAGLALYGDVEACIQRGAAQFAPQIRILSGRVTDQNNENVTRLLERQISEAVEYFAGNYGCKVFNLSLGDLRRPYSGGHVGPLASVVDDLAHRLGVLFIISAGNFYGTDGCPENWRREYPEYFSHEDASILDPAPALNGLTIGSVAFAERSRLAGRFPEDPGHQPVARRDEPSPFTRSGPSIRDAIKPDLVAYGGNCVVDTRVANTNLGGFSDLGVISTNLGFAGGNLFAADGGTSFAAPQVSHMAARLVGRYSQASANLVRALLLTSARVPDAARKKLDDDKNHILNVVGHGMAELERARASSEAQVTLVSETMIGENVHHFYEIPLPEDFLAAPARRSRRITVALSHMPAVRRTRLEYKASDLSFHVVRRRRASEVFRAFQKVKKDEDPEDSIPEYGKFSPSKRARSRGTGQVATWHVGQVDKRWHGQRLFVVVTRRVPKWAEGLVTEEPYALAVRIEDDAEQEIHLYSQVRQKLEVRARVRV